MIARRWVLPTAVWMVAASLHNTAAQADRPGLAYIFPPGGQRGTTVEVRIGGYNLHDSAAFHMDGPGIEAPKRIERTETVFFEGPVIPLPDSQRKEDYPRDYSGTIKLAADAPLGIRRWRVSTSQGVTPAMKFVVGDLPEVVEREIDGGPLPTEVTLPVTINGRVFPREDVDVWTFDAKQGQTITCEVCAARLGSPLDSRLEIRDSAGRRIAENVDALGTDSRVRFTAPVDGTYEARIHDMAFGGLQSYVYRLTITAGPYVDSVYPLGGRRGSAVKLELAGANLPGVGQVFNLPASPQAENLPVSGQVGNLPHEPASYVHRFRMGDQTSNAVVLEFDDLPEHLEGESAESNPVTFPAVLNGRILRPGEIDEWSFEAGQGDEYRLDLRASRLGSPLDSVLTVVDSTGKQLATADDMSDGQTDSRLDLKIPADGLYTVRVQDRLASRGGPEFAYRLRVTRPEPPGFGLRLPADAVTVDRSGEAKLKIDVQRTGGFQDQIELVVESLPAGLTVAGTSVGKGKSSAELVFKAAESAKVQAVPLVLSGKANIDEKEIVRRAVFPAEPGEPRIDRLWLTVAVPTPFKFAGEFETKYAPRGSVYVRHYKLERNGFDGPIEVRLADLQARHLQGVTGPTITVPPRADGFDYPIALAPWMEVGRTSRTCVMAVGVVEDSDGTKHKVSYSSTEQNDQIIVLVDPARLSVGTRRPSIRAEAGGEVRVPVEVGRGAGLSGPVTVELVVPGHIRGMTSQPLTVPAGEREAVLRIQFARGGLGPFNMPLTIRATTTDERGRPVTAEAELTVVPPGS